MGRNGQRSKNTIANTVQQFSRGRVKQKISGRIGNVCVLRGTELLDPLILTGTNNYGGTYFPLIGGTTIGRSVYTFVNVAKNYQKYIYKPGMSFRYTPNCGLNTAGTVYVAYADNPEWIVDYVAASSAVRLDMVRGLASMRSFPVWQEFTFNIQATPRQKMFSTDTSVDMSDADGLNRTCQGVLLVGIEGVTQAATTTYGRQAFNVNLHLEELSATSVA